MALQTLIFSLSNCVSAELDQLFYDSENFVLKKRCKHFCRIIWSELTNIIVGLGHANTLKGPFHLWCSFFLRKKIKPRRISDVRWFQHGFWKEMHAWLLPWGFLLAPKKGNYDHTFLSRGTSFPIIMIQNESRTMPLIILNSGKWWKFHMF